MNYTKVSGENTSHKIILYALSTCPHCNKVKKYLRKKKQAFSYINVDQATRDEKREVTQFLRSRNLSLAFPVLAVDDAVLQGFNETKIDEILKS